MRYFAALGLPAEVAVSAFVLEHAADLLVVLAPAMTEARDAAMLSKAATFVHLFGAALAACAWWPYLLKIQANQFRAK